MNQEKNSQIVISLRKRLWINITIKRNFWKIRDFKTHFKNKNLLRVDKQE